jgi:RNA polymerase sigma-70 factor, ECF subfamily
VDQETDEALLAAHLNGDERSFQTLMERYRQELFHFLIRLLGSRAAAEDVFQDTFLQIHLSGQTFDQTRRFKPWLFTIAVNKARDHFRKNLKRAPVSLSSPLSSDGDAGSIVDLMEADLPGPEEAPSSIEQSGLIKTVVDGMPPHYREILLLSYFQRLSYNQIAELLEIPLGTVKSRLHAAVANFAAAWKAAREKEISDA